MKIITYLERYYDQRHQGIKVRRVYYATFRDFYGRDITVREAIARVFNSIRLAQ